MRYRPTAARVDLSALVRNARILAGLTPHAALCAVVKADAYGHGATGVAQALAAAGVPWFAVALVEEAEALRKAGITEPILAMVGTCVGTAAQMVQLSLSPTVGSVADLEALAAAAGPRGLSIHLEVDTGMARLGLPHAALSEFLAALKRFPTLRLDGLMTHLACSEVPDEPFNQLQLQRFTDVQAAVRDAGYAPMYVHVANSGAVLVQPAAHGTLTRCGLTLYGVNPGPRAVCAALQPVLSWVTRPTLLRHVAQGTAVSYGCRWRAPRDSLIATLPVGYADGYRRSLGNRAQVLVRGRRAAVVGTVCMDLCMVDVTDVAHISVHDDVVLLGSQGEQRITADEMATWADTIAYEILCGIGLRVPRQYVTDSA